MDWQLPVAAQHFGTPMASVELERIAGGYAVKRSFASLPAAMRAVDALLTVAETAFEPVPKPVIPVDAPLQAALERAEQDDPEPHDGRTPVAYPVDEE